jgi:hypothetical protein
MKSGGKRAFSVHLKHRIDGRELRATVYLPTRHRRTRKDWPEPVTLWLSKYSVNMDGRKYQREAGGDNWLQALLLAVEGVRRVIPRDEEQEWMTPREIPAWMIFPRVANIGWGYGHWKKLVDHIEEEEAGINQRIADRRVLQRLKHMDRKLAAEFAAKYKEFGVWFTDMTDLTLRVGDPEAAKSLRRGLAQMLLAIDDVVHLPLRKQHPDLFED